MPAHMEMGTRLTVEHRLEPDRVVLELAGELDLTAAPRLADAITRAESDAARSILVLDVDALTFVDSSGLRVILAAHERARETGQRAFALTAGSPQVKRLLEIAGLEAHLETVADASAALAGPPRERDSG
jgi:anti-sigma B factor antagonist